MPLSAIKNVTIALQKISIADKIWKAGVTFYQNLSDKPSVDTELKAQLY